MRAVKWQGAIACGTGRAGAARARARVTAARPVTLSRMMGVPRQGAVQAAGLPVRGLRAAGSSRNRLRPGVNRSPVSRVPLMC